MQTVAADAINSRNKQKSSQFQIMFQKNSSKIKGKEKRIADTIEETQGKIHNIGKYGGEG